MPLWIGNAPLRLVATRDLNGLGPSESEPVLVEWRWYYHLPSLAIWILVAALLVFVRENRNWQAWTILIPAILLSVVLWPWLVRLAPRAASLFSFTGSGEMTGFGFRALVGGWTALWLMAPWLARRRAVTAFSLALAFLLATGIAAYATAFSEPFSRLAFTTVWLRYLFPPTLWYGTCSLALVLGMTLAAFRCRTEYPSRRFHAWLALGIVAGAFLGTAVNVFRIYPHLAERDFVVPLLLGGGATMWLGVAVLAYLVNLPFMALASRCPLYRDRLREVLRLSKDKV